MPFPPLHFQSFQVTFQFAGIVNLDQFRGSSDLTAGDNPLAAQVQSNAGTGRHPLTFRSLTGHTELTVAPDSASLVTSYTSDYTKSESGGQRLAYAEEKIRATFERFGQLGIKVIFLGTVVTAQLRGNDTDSPDKLKRAAARAFSLNEALAEGEEVFDFQIRTSRTVGEDVFSNLGVSWFQERVFSMPVSPLALLSGQQLLVRDWEALTVIGEGIALTYDRNNKHGLFKGKRDWADEEFIRMAVAGLRDSGPAFDGVCKAIKRAEDG